MRLDPIAAGCLLAVACYDALKQPSGPDSMQLGIYDGAHSGNPHFFWLPPMVPEPTYSGTFDGSLLPVVEICEWTGTACVTPLLAIFTTEDGPNSETVRVALPEEEEPDEEPHYIVNWHTDEFGLDEAKIYRIRVLVDDTQLGYADVAIVGRGSGVTSANSEYVSLKEGRTLPIKFRIEEGAVEQVVRLFTTAEPEDLEGLYIPDPPEAAVARQFVLVDIEQFDPSLERIEFNVDDDVFPVSRDKLYIRSQNDYTWFGVVEGEPYSRVSLTELDGVLVGNLRLPGVIYSVSYRQAGPQLTPD